MTVRCAYCNEEMLGAVNRCWKCGHPLVANAQEPDLPPLRRHADQLPWRSDSLDTTAVADAEVLDDDEDLSNPEPVATVVSDSSAGEPPPPPPRKIEPNASVPVRLPADYRHPAHHPTAATGGAIGSLVLGVASLLVAFFTWAAALLALGGLGLGAWGASSNRRHLALIGMLLCCVALLLSGFNGAVGIYETVYGRKPWDRAYPTGYEETIDGAFDETSDW